MAHPDLERQIADVTAQIAVSPQDADLFLRRGELHRIHRDWPAAEADFKHARELEPRLVKVDFHLGTVALEAGRPKDAKKLLDRFLAREPDHALGLVTRARALVELGEPLAAVKDYTRALAHDEAPDPAYYLERARALESAGRDHLTAAVAGLDEGLARLGQPITLALLAIDLDVERGAYDPALARVDRLAAEASRKESWLVRRGEILERAGRHGQAREAYQEALTALHALPASRRSNRAMQRLEEQVKTALERLDAEHDKEPS